MSHSCLILRTLKRHWHHYSQFAPSSRKRGRQTRRVSPLIKTWEEATICVLSYTSGYTGLLLSSPEYNQLSYVFVSLMYRCRDWRILSACCFCTFALQIYLRYLLIAYNCFITIIWLRLYQSYMTLMSSVTKYINTFFIIILIGKYT